jgi:hypothetical protein
MENTEKVSTPQADEIGQKEKIYKEIIAPEVTRLAELAEEHDFEFLIVFGLESDEAACSSYKKARSKSLAVSALLLCYRAISGEFAVEALPGLLRHLWSKISSIK